MSVAVVWLNRVITPHFWANMLVRLALIGAGVYLAVVSHNLWLAGAYFWGLGIISLIFTWRPKLKSGKLEGWSTPAMLATLGIFAAALAMCVAAALFPAVGWLWAVAVYGLMGGAFWMIWRIVHDDASTLAWTAATTFGYTVQALILSVYRLGQIIIDPLKLIAGAGELRSRADIVLNEDGYFAEFDAREWPVVRRGAGYSIEVKHVGSVFKPMFVLGGAGSWVSIKFDKDFLLTEYQRRQLHAEILKLTFVKQLWGGDYQLSRAIFSLSEGQLDEIDSAIRRARLFQGSRQDDK